MNMNALKAAEKSFLNKYPGGFRHPDLVDIGKKHKMEQLEKAAKECFAKKNFNNPNNIVSETAKLVNRSTMVSMFEKPKFKSMVTNLTKKDKETITESLYELLHGKEKAGFELFLSELRKRKLAKWTLATVVQTYYRPQKDILVKPTTTKLIIDQLELDLEYKSTPTWGFYSKYRKCINEMKSKIDKGLAPNNPAFCGFLMMSLGEKL